MKLGLGIIFDELSNNAKLEMTREITNQIPTQQQLKGHTSQVFYC